MKLITNYATNVKIQCEKCGKIKIITKALYKNKGYECDCEKHQEPIKNSSKKKKEHK